ncbi:lysozyme [Castellaniella sp.]|uniref:lysozyme n=1 Tax=Castellaniella sp. TaxID=1955812 RepID=UPI002AFED2B4|nr:lysozyme [Castellaniella sp.]
MIPDALKRRILQAAAAGASAAVLAGILITHHEGRVYVPYRDPGNGTLTVCDGHTGPDIIPSKRYSDAECDALLAQDQAKAEAAVDRLVRVQVSRFQRAALIDFAFNKGAGNLARSTLLRLTNAGRATEACQEYHRWVKAGGRVLPGLINRGDADAWVCSLG